MSNQNLPNNNDPQGPKKNPLSFWWIYVIGLIIIFSFQAILSNDAASSSEIDYSKFLTYVEDGYVKKVVVTDGTYVTGEYSEKAIEEGIVARPAEESYSLLSTGNQAERFSTTMIPGHDLTEFLAEYPNVEFTGKRSNNFFDNILGWIIPLGFIIIFWMFFLRKMNPGQQVLGIGKSKASLYDKQSANKVNFKDVAGLQEAKQEVEEIVEFLKNPDKFTRLGGSIPKGALLVGPPGTGKTLLAKATAGEADVPFFSLSGSDFVEMFVGVGAARVRDLFKEAKAKAPCIIFIDEIDAIGRMRGRGQMMGSNDERENTLNQLLAEMDGFNSDKAIILMAATNRPDVLDSALLRPGRFDRQIVVDKPDLNGRMEILQVHIKKVRIADDVDIKLLASQTPGFAGAELANLCNEAALLAARRGKQTVSMVDFQDSIERVVAGLEKKNKIISPEERRIVAYHESGHAIVGWFLEHTDPVIKVSIVPRGIAALGYTLQSPLEDRFLMRTEELMDKICGLLGGRVAEDIIFGKISTGAQNDLERVTRLAFAMVAEYGMSEELGHISLRDSQNPDQSFGFNKMYSDHTAQQIDKAVRKIINECYERTTALLVEYKDKLIEMSELLLEKEIMDHNDLKHILGDVPHNKYPEHMFLAAKPSVGSTVDTTVDDATEVKPSDDSVNTESSDDNTVDNSEKPKEG